MVAMVTFTLFWPVFVRQVFQPAGDDRWMVGVMVAICFHADKTGNTEAAREHHTFVAVLLSKD